MPTAASASNACEFSVVIPVHNEAATLATLCQRVLSAIRTRSDSFEVILCDDGSDDGSIDVLRDLAADWPCIKVLRLAHNAGQTAALSAAIAAASGDVIIPMDGDLQNDPADIPLLIDALADQWDVVKGWRRDRQDPYFTSILPSQLANILISRLVGLRLHDYGCTMSAYKRHEITRIPMFRDMHRLMPAFAHFNGARITEVEVRHHARRAGRSHYSLAKTRRVVVDIALMLLVAKYGNRTSHPLHKAVALVQRQAVAPKVVERINF